MNHVKDTLSSEATYFHTYRYNFVTIAPVRRELSSCQEPVKTGNNSNNTSVGIMDLVRDTFFPNQDLLTDEISFQQHW